MDEFIQQLAIRAGKVTAKKFGKVGVKYTKSNAEDVVTEADLAANAMIVAAIKKNYPGHDIISEEIPGGEISSPYLWIVDPLDGTRNFVTKTPLFCTMIGFAKNGVMQLAAIYDPIHKDLYFAKRGRGAFLNGKKMRGSETKRWEGSFGSGTANMTPKRPSFEAARALVASAPKEKFWMSIFGSVGISMMSVASGKRDWGFSLSGALWDYAPASLILKEAGCKATNLAGKPWKLGDKGMVAGNKYLQPKLLKLIKSS